MKDGVLRSGWTPSFFIQSLLIINLASMAKSRKQAQTPVKKDVEIPAKKAGKIPSKNYPVKS